MVNLKPWIALLGVALAEATLIQQKHAKLTRKEKDEGDDDSDDSEDAEDSSADKEMLNDVPPPKKVVAPAPPPPEPKVVAPPPAPKPAPVVVVPPPEPKAMPWDKLEQHLEQVQARQNQLQNELKIWSNHAEWDKKIDADKAALSAATTSALADMLGDIRTELHQLAVPVYTDVLYDNLDALGEKESMLKAQIADMKKAHAKKNPPPAAPVAPENPWGDEKPAQAEPENPWGDEATPKQAPEKEAEAEKEKEEEVRKAETILIVGGLAGGFLAVLAVYMFTKK